MGRDRMLDICEYMVAMVTCGRTIDCVIQDAMSCYHITESEANEIAESVFMEAV